MHVGGYKTDKRKYLEQCLSLVGLKQPRDYRVHESQKYGENGRFLTLSYQRTSRMYELGDRLMEVAINKKVDELVEKLKNAGVYWKRCGTVTGYCSIQKSDYHLEAEGLRAARIHAIIGKHAPQIYAMLSCEGNNQGYMMETMCGLNFSYILNAKPVDGELVITEDRSPSHTKLRFSKPELREIKRQINEEISKPLTLNSQVHGDMQQHNFIVETRTLNVVLLDPWYEQAGVVSDERAVEGINKKLDDLINAL